MLTPLEYLENGLPESGEIWLNGLDIVKHCLKKDHTLTFFKDDSPCLNHWEDWSNAMEERAESDDSFLEIYENAYVDKDQWITIDNDTGMLDVGQFISGDELCFEDDIQVFDTGDCVSVVIDIGIPFRERNDYAMQTRHKKVYSLIAQCDSENKPIQVIGVLPIIIPESKEVLKIFVTIKEYNDTIFPAIWGTLTTNLTCNWFVNVIMDYFIGTSTPGNGRLVTLKDIDKFFPEQEELHLFGKRIESKYNQNKGE